MCAKMVVQFKLGFCLFLAFAMICSARNTISISGDGIMNVGFGGRSLKMSLDDYGEASANTGHDPKNDHSHDHGDGDGNGNADDGHSDGDDNGDGHDGGGR